MSRAAADVLEQLARARRAVSLARDAHGRVTGCYRASVTAAREPGAVRWHERGTTRAPGSDRRTDARNAQLWRTERGELILEHTRRGDPVPIARFPIDALGFAWTQTTEPHPCDRDLYIGSIRLAERGIELDWTVRTPRGDERIAARYRP